MAVKTSTRMDQRSPSLGGPARNGSLNARPPAVSDARIVKKLVLRGRADQRGARYQLYLQVDIPSSSQAQLFPLLPDANVKLLGWNIDGLSPEGGYPPLQESAARAGHYLGIPMSSTQEALQETPSSPPRIIVSDYMITIAAPAQSDVDPQYSSKKTYLVTLDLTSKMVLEPPKWHHMLHLFVPRCLHSKINFSFSPEVIEAGDLEVTVDPPLTGKRPPRPSRRASGSPAPDFDDDARSTVTGHSEDSEDVEEGDPNGSIKGFFKSTDQLTLRWASGSAGRLHPQDELPSLSVEQLHVHTLAEYGASQDGQIRLNLTSELRMDSLSSAGISDVFVFPMLLESYGQTLDNVKCNVDAASGLRSWFLVPSQQQETANSTPLPNVDESAILNFTDDEISSSDGEDLLSTRPPKGIDHSLDLSQIDLRPSADKLGPLQIRQSGASPASSQPLLLFFDSAAVYAQAQEALTLTARISVTIAPSQDPIDCSNLPVKLPILRAPTAVQQTAQTVVQPLENMAIGHSITPYRYNIRGAIAQDSLDFTVDLSSNGPPEAETCFLQLQSQEMSFADVTMLGSVDMSQQRSSSSFTSFIGTPPAVHRPQPVYDAIELHDDPASRPSVSTSCELHCWILPTKLHRSGPSSKDQQQHVSRLLAELNCSWPYMQDGRQPEEIDIWLPHPSGSVGPTVHSCEVDGERVEATTSETGDSVCLHVRRPIRPAEPEEDQASPSSLCKQLSLFVEYPQLPTGQTFGAASTPSTAPTALTIPMPLFSQEVLKLTLTVDHQRHSSAGLARGSRSLVAPDFDFVSSQRGDESNDASANHHHVLHKFTLPPLAPLSLTLLEPAPGSASKVSRLSSPGTSSFFKNLPLLCLALVAIFSYQAQFNENQQVQLESLTSKVEQLALANNVDFRDGSWRPEEIVGRGRVEGEVAALIQEDVAEWIDGNDRALSGSASTLEGNNVDSSEAVKDSTRIPQQQQAIATALDHRRPSPLEAWLRTIAWPFLAIGQGGSLLFETVRSILLR